MAAVIPLLVFCLSLAAELCLVTSTVDHDPDFRPYYKSTITTFFLVIALVQTTASKETKEELKQKTVTEILGSQYIKAETLYKAEDRDTQAHILKIRAAYEEYIEAMFRVKMMQKFICANKTVIWDFLEAKSNLTALVIVYMQVKKIPDKGLLGLEISTDKGSLVVPISKARFAPNPSWTETMKGMYTCVHPIEGYQEVLPSQDLKFYQIEYKGCWYAPEVDKGSATLGDQELETLI